ncbi:hypothetical protein AAP_06287 [Ascosphaera apis ARSEF 7405]|uniref:Uncharacterized protein n=1 Tax=Ascosphaera apis ARSEF 7405 TaxID=392613 RepID=A0A162HZR3_9EURO|nr:hypothetical protein AAP_06287 [Ascosphaera apis ARSEF 7405]
MFSTRTALRIPAQLPSAAIKASTRPATRLFTAAKPPMPTASIEGRRYMTAYGYTQTKSLVYSQYGEPKDVLNTLWDSGQCPPAYYPS